MQMKYALTGNLTAASQAIAGMPERWRACLKGTGEVDLRALTPLSDRYYLFAESSTLGRLTGFFASKSLDGRVEKLSPQDYPPVFREPGFDGVVYALNELVLDTRQLLLRLQTNLAGCVYRHELKPEHVQLGEHSVELRVQGGVIAARKLILCAGAGNATLLNNLPTVAPKMQLRPLQQVVVRHNYPHPLYAHCLTGIRRAEPRLTITSHASGDHWVWYIGGQLASDGASMSEAELVAHARSELKTCVPWICLRHAEFSTLRVDRAEPLISGRQRPNEAFAAASGSAVICWPTKLSLVPDLADKVLGLLAPATTRPQTAIPNLPLPVAEIGAPGWEA